MNESTQVRENTHHRFTGWLWATLASLLFWAVAGGCLLATGCQVHLTPANTLFGDAAKSPKLTVSKNWFGMKAEAGTDFAGDVDVVYDPATKAFSLKGKVSSAAGSVLDKYPAWIGSMDATRLADIASIEARQRAYSEGIADGIRAAGEAGSSLAAALVPAFTGSGSGNKAKPIESFLSVWNSFPESERSALLAKLLPTP